MTLEQTMPATAPVVEIGITLVAQVIVALVWALPAAGILAWRALKMKTWPIRFRSAYVVALKAVIIALVLTTVTVFALVLPGVMTRPMATVVGLGVGVIAWLYVHAAALLKLAGTSFPLTVKEARDITGSVFVFLILFNVLITVVSIFLKSVIA